MQKELRKGGMQELSHWLPCVECLLASRSGRIQVLWKGRSARAGR
jgi:hypothetical protein